MPVFCAPILTTGPYHYISLYDKITLVKSDKDHTRSFHLLLEVSAIQIFRFIPACSLKRRSNGFRVTCFNVSNLKIIAPERSLSKITVRLRRAVKRRLQPACSLSLLTALGWLHLAIRTESEHARRTVVRKIVSFRESLSHRLQVAEPATRVWADEVSFCPFVPVVQQQHGARQTADWEGIRKCSDSAQKIPKLRRGGIPPRQFVRVQPRSSGILI